MYSRRGDRGDTDTGTGSRTAKDAGLIEVEGTIDELNSFLGMAAIKSLWDDIAQDISRIQLDIFTLGEHIILQGNGRSLSPEDTLWLEQRVDHYRKEVGPTRLFVVPGGSEQSASLHIARTVCRRLERRIVAISEPLKVSEHVLSYINRLSSVLFMMALAANRRLSVKERIWELRTGKR